MEGKKSSGILVVILVLVVIALSGYIAYDKLLVKNVNKKYIVENFLIRAWNLYHEGV